MPRRAADLIVDCLAAHGVDRIFCVPGESYLAVLDALHDSNAIQTIVCRHESGAGFAAVGDGKQLSIAGGAVLLFVGIASIAAHFVPAHLDSQGVPIPATGTTKARIDAEWERVRRCAGLLARPPH